MTKSELIDQLAEIKNSLTHYQAEIVINLIFNSMVEALQDGDKVEIRGFGSFTIREREAREARNPRTGVPVKISGKKLPFFKTGKELRKRVDNTV